MSVRTTHLAFGLRWSIPFPMPTFHPVDDAETDIEPDVQVVETSIPKPAAGSAAGPLRMVTDGSVVAGLPGSGRLRISNGRLVEVERFPGCTDEGLWLLIMGLGASLILSQRGFLPFHAVAVDTPRGALLVAGQSGAGKSTLFAELQRRGLRPLGDDLVPITVRDGVPLAHPGSAVMKLWADSAEMLGLDIGDAARVRPGLNKYFVALRDPATGPVPIGAVVVLNTHNLPDISVRRLQSAQRFTALLDHTWQKLTVRKMGLAGDHFRMVTALAAEAPVLKVTRPTRSGPGVGALADAVLQEIGL